MIEKPHPETPLRVNDFFILTADLDGVEIDPEVWFELLSDIWSELWFRGQLHQRSLRLVEALDWS